MSQQIADSGLECLQEAYLALDGNGWTNPIDYANGQIKEVVSIEESVPTDLVRAKTALQDGRTKDAKQYLKKVLKGTYYEVK